MVFYIIAVAEKEKGTDANQQIKYVPEATTVAKIKNTKSFKDAKNPSEIHPMDVSKINDQIKFSFQ